MSQTCKNHVGPTCKALGLPAAVLWLWQVTSELRAAAVVEVKLWHEDAAITATWIEGTTCKKMQYCIVALHLSFPTLVGRWTLYCGTKMCNQLLQFAGFAQGMCHDRTSNPKHKTRQSGYFRYSRNFRLLQILQKLQILQQNYFRLLVALSRLSLWKACFQRLKCKLQTVTL